MYDLKARLEQLRLQHADIGEEIRLLETGRRPMPGQEREKLIDEIARHIAGYTVEGAQYDCIKISFLMTWEEGWFPSIQRAEFSKKGIRSGQAKFILDIIKSNLNADDALAITLGEMATETDEHFAFKQTLGLLKDRCDTAEEHHGVDFQGIIDEGAKRARKLQPAPWKNR